MESLHNKLDKIKSEYAERSTLDNTNKHKSIYGSVTHHPIDWKKSIRTIETRYMEVFYEGSFKYYRKLYQLYQFSYPLRTIRIEEWASFCLNKRN